MISHPQGVQMKYELDDWVVLIIDDEPNNLEAIKVTLEHFGAKVFTALSGLKGIEILKSITPTLILLDLAMSEMDGWEVIKNIRTIPALKEIPVIAVTAHAMISDRERALKSGFDGYLAKPFRPSKVIDEILGIIAN